MSQKFSHFKIRLASPEEIRSWSYGEVKKHETINYRTLKPEKDGLFCEVIFGPTKDYQCACSNKSKRSAHPGKKCPVCGVEYTESKVRRERMGHIELAAPVVHAWYLRNTPSRLAILLDIKSKDLEEVVYLASYIVVDAGDTDLQFKQILSEADYTRFYFEYGSRFRALTGAEAVKHLLKRLDLEKEALNLRIELKTASKQRRDKIIKRLNVVEAFKNSDNKPEWMILEVLPVIPPDLRPMVQLDGGRFATTDLNDLYRRILNRNNRLKRQFEQGAPHLITKNEKRMLQEAVDALIDNSKRGRKVVVERNRALKSLSDMLRGKQGRFRQNLLGKRVDYSGRSVIVVGPDLEMYQCGLPKEMAIILFKPFVIRELISRGITSNIRSAKRLIETLDGRIWAVLEDVIREHPVLLNRAPTLHRLGIQAFEPKLVEGKAIRLHPLVTTAFNADFDGDQMAVHVPLSEEAQAEARVLMLASNNILNPKDGKPVVTPGQDMVLGNYYLTVEKAGEVGEGNVFKDVNEVIMAYENHYVTLHSRIAIQSSALHHPLAETLKDHYLMTTPGKLIFNTILPDTFPYINEPTQTNLEVATPAKYFIEPGENIREKIRKMTPVAPFKKKFLSMIIAQIFAKYKINETSKMLDKMKNIGFKYSTIAGITVAASDVMVYSKKQEVLERHDHNVDEITGLYNMGLLTDSERAKLVIQEWAVAKDEIQKGLIEELDNSNHIFMMSDSGARGNPSNFTQLAGMRGLMANPSGQTIELPIKASFREGLTMSEFFISTHGARKGSTDTALKTAESGYLTRRLVDVSQDVVITEEDCHTDKGVRVKAVLDRDGKVIESLFDRINGRYASIDFIHPYTGEILVHKNHYISEEIAKAIVESAVNPKDPNDVKDLSVAIRTALTCTAKVGICRKCYGQNLATGEKAEVGESVGTIAAQSIGEPGTQLTMRTFHTGGVAGEDITQGLPRVQELFEARKSKLKAIISEINGEVDEITPVEERSIIIIKNEIETKKYETNSNVQPLVSVGDKVTAGMQLTEGAIDPKELLRVADMLTVQQYILKEVQKVYRSQAVEISDKHIEIIVRQMTRKMTVILEGDTELLPGSQISVNEFIEANKVAFAEGKRPAIAKPVLLGITKASLRSESFLSACSFQETTRVLTDAAIRGKSDPLLGLKENVIIGGLIPAGTGILRHKSLEYEAPEEEEDPYADFEE
ncbi:MAG: DNA-directed RNA polymerase subunit beta' [Candidatus Izemoplasmatales bacterium]|jgi:DNA-directed RNA polymerase subunit beta'|nr:DNA-directed RNA polymerase subunit beta' [Candidatus Izemoplasmatales bacterium]MDD4354987.1 DNA-directed RNA polymerase subunit beta' [Candidatus Izemoplasmatales bacterium]MDD4988221.1 DNA-directed RNA polymerase subunit beta' [Candidatus Izemoplasmatales bacterium]NLF48261.1 DNA-directed RNA polymerase subunit beta' [Acholeplasmataceae bacterium]